MLAAEAVDWVARLIAACGLGLAALSTWIAVLAYRRDRPDLQLRWEVNDVVPFLDVYVHLLPDDLPESPFGAPSSGSADAAHGQWSSSAK